MKSLTDKQEVENPDNNLLNIGDKRLLSVILPQKQKNFFWFIG